MLVQAITGTTRQGRFSELVAAWVMTRLSGHPAFDVELVDLRDHELPFFDGEAPARTGRDYGSDAVARFGEVIDRGDGYLILTGEYNHGYPAVLKNALDSTFPEWRRKPVAFVGLGQHRWSPGDRAVAPGGDRVRNGAVAPRRPRPARRPDRGAAGAGSDRPGPLRPARAQAHAAGRRSGLVGGALAAARAADAS